MTEAQQRAQTNYRKKCKVITLQFCPPEMDIYNYIKKNSKSSVSSFIKSCIKEKMSKGK